MPANHRARALKSFLEGLSLAALEDAYCGCGSPPYRPDLMLSIALWEVWQGRPSPAQWFRDAHENIVVQWLGQGIFPSRSAWYDFRDRVGDVILEIHATAVRLGIAEGLVDPREGVLDGTYVRACASRHRTINLSVLERRREELAAAIARDEAGELIQAAPRWMAKTAGGRQQQSRRYAQAHEALARRLADHASRPKDKRLPENRVTINPSDPEAPIGRDKEKVCCPLYTVQFFVEPSSLVILSFDVFAQVTDSGTLAVMLDRTQEVTGQPLEAALADAAYASLLDLVECERRGVELFAPVQENSFTEKKRASAPQRIERDSFQWLPDEQTYLCPQGHRLDYRGRERKRRRGNREVVEHRYHCSAEHCRDCPLAQRCVRDPMKGRTVKRLEGQERIDAHRAKMKTPEAQAKYKLRSQVIERCFGDAKEHRKVRKLHGRGLRRARAEIGLIVLAQTIQTLLRLRAARATVEVDSS